MSQGRLQDKVAIITGTGRGMARDIALRFAGEGAAIVGCDIDAEAAAETVEIVRAAGGIMESLHPLDLMDEDNARRLSQFAVDTFGRLDVLYNNSRSSRFGWAETVSLEDWQLTLDQTLTMNWLVTKHAIPHFRAGGGGSIIFVGSITGDRLGGGYPGNLGFLAPYAVAKAGIARLAVILANDLGSIGVRVNVISPGIIRTERNTQLASTERLRELAARPMVLQRMGTPEDVANAALFFASDESSFITGQNLGVDGGWSASGGVGVPRDEDRAAVLEVVASGYAAARR